MFRSTTIAFLACLAPAALGQATQGDWLVAGSPDPTSDVGGGLFLVDPAQGTTTPLQNVTGDLVRGTSLVPDPMSAAVFYVGTSGEVKGVPGPANLYKVTLAAGRVVTSTKLNTDTMTADVEIYGLHVVGDQLLFGSRDRIGSVSLSGGATQTILKFSGNNNRGYFTTDGRYLYGAFFNNNGWQVGGGTVRRVDLQNPTKAEDWIRVDQFPTNVRDIWIDSRGRLATLDKGNFGSPTLRLWDVHTKKQLGQLVLPFQSLAGLMRGAIDPSDDTIVISGQGITFSDSRYALCTIDSNLQITKSLYGPVAFPLNGVAVRRAPGLIRRGQECTSTLQPGAWTGASGPASAGNQNYALELVAPANTPAVALIAIHNSLAAPVTFPGTQCELGVLPLFTIAGVVPATGTLSLPLPLAKNYAGINLDTQWVVIDAGANANGFVTTQVGAVFIR